MAEFQIGDRVTVDEQYGFVGNAHRTPDESLSGTICHVEPAICGVRFDENVDGHDCAGYCESGYGWFIPKKHLLHETEISSIPQEAILEVLSNG